jgi:hypothetical protein
MKYFGIPKVGQTAILINDKQNAVVGHFKDIIPQSH